MIKPVARNIVHRIDLKKATKLPQILPALPLDYVSILYVTNMFLFVEYVN